VREWPRLYNHGSKPPSYTTVRIYLKSRPEAVRTLAKEGEKVFNNKMRPFVIRDYRKLAVNEIWVSDHMRHDVFVRNDLDLPGSTPDARLRLWLTAFMDVRSRKIVGMSWCVNPSSESISSALRVAVAQFGVPREVLIDNGEDYKKISKQVPLSPELNGVMARLEMRVRRALPYEPQAKPIESFFRTLHQRFDAKLAPYYCGPSPERRPEECALIIKEHDQYLSGKIDQSPLLPASEFIAMAAMWLVSDYNSEFEHSGHGMDGRTPNEIFDELLPEASRQRCNPQELAPLFWEREKRVLREGGCVMIRKERYEPADAPSAAQLQLHNAKEIIIACDPMNLGEAIALDLDGRFLGFLRSQERTSWNLSKEELRAMMRDRARLGRVTKDYLAGLARRRELAGDSTELDVMRQRVGIVEAVPDSEQHRLPSEAIAPMRARRIAAAAAAAPDYSADVADRLRMLREEGGD
jgi:putative transposase